MRLWDTALAVVLAMAAALTASAAPLSLQTATLVYDMDNFVGIQASPDGRWLAFDVADSREALTFEYSTQSFTATGVPMWASLAVYRKHLVEVATGREDTLGAPVGVSWGGAWSPDGSRYAFYSDRAGMAALWVWDRATGQARQLTPDLVRNFRNNEGPMWTPDGRSVVYRAIPEGMTFKDLARLDPAFARETHQHTQNEAASHIYQANIDVAQSKEQTARSPLAGALEGYLQDRFLGDLVVADANTGATRRLARGLHPFKTAISPDGRWVAVLDVYDIVANSFLVRAALKVISLTDGSTRVLDPDVSPADPADFNWSPDSSALTYPTFDGAAHERRSCYVVRVADGRRVRISDRLPQSIQSFRWGAPLWNAKADTIYLLDTPQPDSRDPASHLWAIRSDGSSAREIGRLEGRRIEDIVRADRGGTYWSPDDGSTMVVRTHATGTKQDGFYALNVVADRATRLLEGDFHVFHPLTATVADRTHIAFFQETATHAMEAFRLDVRARTLQQVSKLHPEIDRDTLGTAQLVEWRSDQGELLRGTLLLPPRSASVKPAPLVVWVYAGSKGSDAVNRYGLGWGPLFNMQVLTTRGYAVLFPDVPQRPGTPAADVGDAVLPAINKLVDLRLVDPERVAVMGQSFGGYSVMALLTRTTRFKAAVITDSAPADAFEGYAHFYEGTDTGVAYYETGQGGLGGSPWERPLRYLENSPFFFLDRVRTPVLIARGADDPISVANGSIFNALKRLGVPVQLIEYEHEGHELQKPTNMIDFWERRLSWLERYLGTVPAAGTPVPLNH